MINFLYTIYILIIGSLMMIVGGLIILVISIIFPKITYPLIRMYTKTFVRMVGVKVKIEGNFPENGPYIVMANHSSILDPFLWGTFMKGNFTGIVANKNMKYPVYGWILKRMRAVAINRKNRAESIERINDAENVLKDGYHIGIHPEGTRTLTGKMNPLKKGGFYMAKNTKTSILPIGFQGAYNFKPKNRFTVRPSKVIIRIGEPILYTIYKSTSIDELIEITTDQLKTLSGEIS